MSKNYVFQLSNRKMGVFENLTKETFGNIIDDQKKKNDFAFAALNFAGMNEKCKELISQIDNQLSK